MDTYRINGIYLELDEKEDLLYDRAAKKLGINKSAITSLKLFRKSVDARKGAVRFVCSVDVSLARDTKPRLTPDVRIVENTSPLQIRTVRKNHARPVVVGFGPAGMFCALILAKAGLSPVVLERGKKAEDRIRDVDLFLKTGQLDPESNVQFGEGGAGMFSDGKLNTLVHDKDVLGRFVLETLVQFGAPEEILWQNKPHVGTDKLTAVMTGIRREIERQGGEVRFQTAFVKPVFENQQITGAVIRDNNGEKIFPCRTIFLAPGHSARDVFYSLREAGVAMEKKIFSVGVRIEHKQKWLNERQYGKFAGHPSLSAADYKLAVQTKTGKTLYSFCMCPGGVVMPSASLPGGVVTNGMSRHARNGENANAALLVSISPKELSGDLFSGFLFQKTLEEKAFKMGGGGFTAPAQTVGDFIKKQRTASFGSVSPTYALGVNPSDLDALFPENVCETIRDGIRLMDNKLKGFAIPDAVLTGPESRSTCPVRILRGENRQSEMSGLYPIGEGAGYAGGIMSAAMDGIKSALSYLDSIE